MVRLYLDDGHPESDEFESNYLSFDDRDPEAIRVVQQRLLTRGREDVAHWLDRFYADRLASDASRGGWFQGVTMFFGRAAGAESAQHARH